MPRHSSWPKGLGRPSIRADPVGRSPHPVFALRRISANSCGSAPLLSGGLGVRPGAIIERLPPGCTVTPSFLRFRPGIPLRRLQACALRHHAELEEAPQLDQQLPGEGHDPHLAGSGPAAAEPRLIPAAQAAPRLIPQPAPGHLDGDRPDVPTPRLADPLFPMSVATLVRRRREPRRRPDLLAGAEPSPPEELVHIDPRAGGPDRAQAEQLPDFGDGLAAPPTSVPGGSQRPWFASRPFIRFATRMRSCFKVRSSRCSWRRSSASTVGTRTTLHTARSPAWYRSSIPSSLRASRASDFARRSRRFTSMLDESTTTFAIPLEVKYRCSQNPSRPAS